MPHYRTIDCNWEHQKVNFINFFDTIFFFFLDKKLIFSLFQSAKCQLQQIFTIHWNINWNEQRRCFNWNLEGKHWFHHFHHRYTAKNTLYLCILRHNFHIKNLKRRILCEFFNLMALVLNNNSLSSAKRYENNIFKFNGVSTKKDVVT